MHFHIQRYFYGLLKRRAWLLLILIPSVLYLAAAAINFDHFTITQDISITKDTPLGVSAAKSGATNVDAVVKNPDLFFLNTYAVRQLYANLYAGTAVYRADRQFRVLLGTISATMSLAMPEANRVRITYYGPDEKMGRILVSYYSQRLMSKANEGIAQSRTITAKDQMPAPAGEFSVEKHRALWRAERIIPLTFIAVVSVFVVLVLLGILEWNDTSFKSERQVAQYIDLPIIGSLPNLDRIFAAIGMER